MISVREFAVLTTQNGSFSIDRATISDADFAWLADSSRRSAENASFINVTGRGTLTVQNYVGVLRLPSGNEIEVLPKHTHDTNSVHGSRQLLFRMIAQSLGISPRVAEAANLKVLNRPFTEWMAETFLREATVLVSRGFRRDYLLTESKERSLRGRLHIARQMRAGPADATNFHVEHDIYSFDRPENRAIKSAVKMISRQTAVASTWQTAAELLSLLGDIPESRDVKSDLRQWRSHRLMAYYEPLREICSLILTGRTPFAVSGPNMAQSMLFPMEKLFEGFVVRAVQKALPATFKVHRQPRRHKLCHFGSAQWFDLRPDLLVTRDKEAWILDAKWKILHGVEKEHYGLSQSDFYQLNAYGQTYLGGTGDLFLIYPRTPGIPAFGKPFRMQPNLRLYVLAIDLEDGSVDLSPIKESAGRLIDSLHPNSSAVGLHT